VVLGVVELDVDDVARVLVEVVGVADLLALEPHADAAKSGTSHHNPDPMRRHRPTVRSQRRDAPK